MAWQNRQALDWLLAEKGGVCALIGEMCCTFIPNNTAPNGTFTLAMNNLKRLRKEVHDNAGRGQDMFGWIRNINLGAWGTMFAQIGLVLLIVLVGVGLIFCCCIPILRSMIASRLDKQMIVMRGTVETTRVEWEYVGNQNGGDDEVKEADLEAMLVSILGTGQKCDESSSRKTQM